MNNSYDTTNYCYIQCNGTANPMQLWIDNAGAGESANMHSVALNTWYWAAVVSDSSGNTKAYYSTGAGTISTATCSTYTTPNLTAVGLHFGKSVFDSEEWAGDIAYGKVWTTALTAAEAKTERFSILPIKRASLFGCYPFFRSGSAQTAYLKDYSGLGHPLSLGGSPPADGSAPPNVTWSFHAPAFMKYTAPVGGLTPRLGLLRVG